MEEIRKSAFEPIFDSFRNILGDTMYEYAQLPEDEAQENLLKSLFDEDSSWKIWKTTLEEITVSFISIRTDEKTKVGEIGLNAVHPSYANKGIGTGMYNFAVEVVRKEGMKVGSCN